MVESMTGLERDRWNAAEWYQRVPQHRCGPTIPLIIILGTHAGLLIYSARIHSPALDEVAHLPAGLSCWERGRLGLYPVNPPLIRCLAAAAGVEVESGNRLDGRCVIARCACRVRCGARFREGQRPECGAVFRGGAVGPGPDQCGRRVGVLLLVGRLIWLAIRVVFGPLVVVLTDGPRQRGADHTGRWIGGCWSSGRLWILALDRRSVVASSRGGGTAVRNCPVVQDDVPCLSGYLAVVVVRVCQAGTDTSTFCGGRACRSCRCCAWRCWYSTWVTDFGEPGFHWGNTTSRVGC